jgi:ribosomal protein L9
MATEKLERDAFLAVIDRKIAALKALAESYRTAMALGAIGQPGEIDLSTLGSGGSRSESPMDLPQGALLGKSLPAAVKLWLTAARRKQTVKEITAALRDGGVESTSPNFESVITGALHRLKANNEVLRFKDGWALAELYPASLRSSLTKDAKAAIRATRTTQRTKKAARQGQRKARKAEPAQHATDSNKTDFITEMLPTDPGSGMTVADVLKAMQAAGTDSSRDYVRVVLKRLRKRGKIDVRDGRHFRTSGRATAGSHAA